MFKTCLDLSYAHKERWTQVLVPERCSFLLTNQSWQGWVSSGPTATLDRQDAGRK